VKTLVFFASGSGSNLQAVLDAIHNGRLHARVGGLICNRRRAGVLQRARIADIPVCLLTPEKQKNEEVTTQVLLEQLRSWSPDLIVLAGYLRKVPDTVLREWPGRIINIHPSLLPRHGGKGFYGLNVHRSVLESGDMVSGCTVHLVTEAYDAGPILGRREVPVLPDDTPETLQQRVLREEHHLLPEVITQIIT